MFARKIRVELLELDGSRPCPVAWLDSFSMRSFTGRSAFDETLPVTDGELEVSFQVDLEVLRLDMQDWLTRKFGDGKTVELRLSEKGTLNREQSAVQRGESKAGGLESVEAEPGEDA